jgi:hypothetical protein
LNLIVNTQGSLAEECQASISTVPVSVQTKSSKVKVKVKFTLEQATKAQKERRGITVLFL